MTETNMQIKFYQAECGDAARIRFTGKDKVVYNIFIDSGYLKTYREILRPEIERLKADNEQIDMWVISHIHDDHIAGATGYVSSIGAKEFPEDGTRWLYNAPRHTNAIYGPSISDAKSIDSGNQLTTYLIAKNKLPIKDITTEHESLEIGGLMITVLSPGERQLALLRKKYSSAKFLPLEKNEYDVVSTAMSRNKDDYEICVGDFNLQEWKEDTSPENGSSIALLIQYKAHTSLWLADAHPSVIVKALKRLGYSRDTPICCDLVKVCHHASSGNNSNELYAMINCSNYIISANGKNNYLLPHKECLARILRNDNRESSNHYHFYFTHRNQVIERIFKADGEDVYMKYNFTIHYTNEDTKWLLIE